MTDWNDSSEQDPYIGHVEGRPRDDSEPLTRRELLTFDAARKWLLEKLVIADDLVEAYARGKALQEDNAATKTLAEAAECSARADETAAKTRILSQEELAKAHRQSKVDQRTPR